MYVAGMGKRTIEMCKNPQHTHCLPQERQNGQIKKAKKIDRRINDKILLNYFLYYIFLSMMNT